MFDLLHGGRVWVKLSVLADWAETDGVARILVRNPAKLSGFD